MPMPRIPPGINMERCTFRTIKKVMMAIKLATAWIKNSVRFIILFHKDEGDRCTGTKCKSNEESLKEFAHPRVEVVIHQISDSIGHGDSRNERHDTAGDNEIGIGRKTTIARPDMGQKTKDKGGRKGSGKRNANVFLNDKRKSKGKDSRNTRSNRIIEISSKHDGEERRTESCCNGQLEIGIRNSLHFQLAQGLVGLLEIYLSRDELTRDLIDITDLFDIVIGPQDPFHARDIGILN